MTIDLIFATNSSGTYEAAQAIADVLTAGGHTVRLSHAQAVTPSSVGSADLTILGSCTWERFENGQRLEGQLQQHMYALAQALGQRKLPGKHFAVFALGDSSYTDFANAATHLETLVRQVGGQQVGSSLRIDGWFFNQPRTREQAIAWAKQLKLE